MVCTYSSRRIANACSADAGSLGDAVDDHRLIAELDRGAISLLQSEACCNRKQRQEEDEETHCGCEVAVAGRSDESDWEGVDLTWWWRKK